MNEQDFYVAFTLWDDAGNTLISDAMNSRAKIMDAYNEYFNRISMYLGKIYDTQKNYDFTDVTTILDKTKEQIYNYLTAIDGRGILSADRILVPAIFQENVDKWTDKFSTEFNRKGPNGRANLLLSCAAALIAETSKVGTVVPLKIDRTTPTLDIEVASYLAWKSAVACKNSIRDEVATIIEGSNNNSEKLRRSLLDNISRSEANNSEHKKLMAELPPSIESFKQKSDAAIKEAEDRAANLDTKIKDFLTQIDASDGNLQAFTRAVREELKIDTAKKLWDERARSNYYTFFISACFVLALLVTPIQLGFDHRTEILAFINGLAKPDLTAFLPPDGDSTTPEPTAALLTAMTLSRLIIVSLPIALYFWLIKLMVRYTMRSLVLSDDARQRATMMDTYFHLIEKNGASTEDRALVLAALFRPAPGHGPDNVEPPDFTDLVKQMKGS